MEIIRITRADTAVLKLLAQLNDYTDALYPAECNELDPFFRLQLNHVLFVGAYINNQLVGCGAAKNMGDYGELKRLYVSPQVRGKGVATHLLNYLQNYFKEQGIRCIYLETGIYQREALALYRKSGFRESRPFGDYQSNRFSVFFQKAI